MGRFRSLSHSAWDCKYRVVFMPKRRRRTRDVALREPPAWVGQNAATVAKPTAVRRDRPLESHDRSYLSVGAPVFQTGDKSHEQRQL